MFLSSHVLSEVEEVADRVGIVRAGRLAAVEEVSVLKKSVAPNGGSFRGAGFNRIV